MFDFTMTCFDDAKNLGDFAFGDPMILRHFDARLKPDLQLTVRRLDVDVHPILFQREKVEAVASVAKDGRTHTSIVALANEVLRGAGLRRLTPRIQPRGPLHHGGTTWKVGTQRSTSAATQS